MRSLTRRLPGRADLATFLSTLRKPHRLSVLRAAADGLLVAWVLRRRGVRPLLPGGRPDRRSDPGAAREVAAAVDAGLAVVPVAATCLRRSIGLIRELERLGLASTVHIGVRRTADHVEAHAWVQVGEIVINDDPVLVSTYAELAAGEADQLLAHFR